MITRILHRRLNKFEQFVKLSYEMEYIQNNLYDYWTEFDSYCKILIEELNIKNLHIGNMVIMNKILMDGNKYLVRNMIKVINESKEYNDKIIDFNHNIENRIKKENTIINFYKKIKIFLYTNGLIKEIKSELLLTEQPLDYLIKILDKHYNSFYQYLLEVLINKDDLNQLEKMIYKHNNLLDNLKHILSEMEDIHEN